MTVRELIVQLLAQPQDAEVVLNMDLNELANSLTPSQVRTAQAIPIPYSDNTLWQGLSPIDEPEDAKEIVVIES